VNLAIQALLTSLRTTVSNIRGNKQTFLISVMTIAISIGILGLFLIVFFNLNVFLSSWNQHVQVVVYLEDGISPSKKSRLKDLFKSNLEIQSTEEVSKERAWQEFKLHQSNNGDIKFDLGFNPLPASYKIRFNASENRSIFIKEFAEQLRGEEGVESVEYGEEWIGRFENFMVFCRVFLLGVGTLLSLGLILIISNTIRLSIYSRQDEIELMLLIGATPSFVKIPFLLEGMLQGLVGSLVSLGFMGSLYIYLKNEFQSSIDSIARGMDFQFISQPILLMLVGLSVLIGFVASYISTYQYMQVLNKR
jgi:cell division transport system permease protein